MSDKFCFSKNNILIFSCIIIIIIISNIDYTNKKIYNKLINNNLQTTLNNNIQPDLNNNIESTLNKQTILNIRDKKVLDDSFHPPERRLPEHQYPNKYIKTLINIPTRGYPDNYQLLGIVSRNNTETIYNLFGRQTFPNSNQYEYYIQATLHNNTVKIPISIYGDKEIVDNQSITIPGMNPSNDKFIVKLYNYDVPRYIP